MKQLLPSKMVDGEVRYSSSEVGRLTTRGAVPRLYAEPAGTICEAGYKLSFAVLTIRFKASLRVILAPMLQTIEELKIPNLLSPLK